jgi:hypothetical protein
MPKPAVKKSKTEPSLVDEEGNIPVNEVGRLLRYQVDGKETAIEGQKVLKKIHDALKAQKVKGFDGTHRFLCMEKWDVEFWIMFKNHESLKTYLDDSPAFKEVMAMVEEELKPLAKNGHLHWQSFTHEAW